MRAPRNCDEPLSRASLPPTPPDTTPCELLSSRQIARKWRGIPRTPGRRWPLPRSGKTRCEWGRFAPMDWSRFRLCPSGLLDATDGALHQIAHERNFVAVVAQRLSAHDRKFASYFAGFRV